MPSQAVRLLAAAWLVLFAVSFALLAAEPAGDDSATRALNRLASFMTWQGVAFAPAAIAAALTYKEHGVERPLGFLPLAISVLVISLLVAIIAFRVLVQPSFG